MSSLRNIRRVHLVLTSQCNLRCGYCFQNDKKPGRMEWETLRRAIDLALGSRHDTVELTFFGGEPLLEFPSIRRAVEYAESARPAAMTLLYSMSTNGLLLTDEILDFLEMHRFMTQVSFDGVPEAQELRGRGTFETLDRWLRSVVRDRPEFVGSRLRIGLTLLPRTVPYFGDAIVSLLDRGICEIAISPAMANDRGWRLERIGELEAEFARILDASLARYHASGAIPLQAFRGGPTANKRGSPAQRMCGVARGEEPAVDVDGRVHGCGMFAESVQRFRGPMLRHTLEGMAIGDIDAPDLARRFAAYEPAARAAEMFGPKSANRSGYGSCRDCRYIASCSICPVSIGNSPGNEDPNLVPDFGCAYNLVALAHRDHFWKRAGIPPFAILAQEVSL